MNHLRPIYIILGLLSLNIQAIGQPTINGPSSICANEDATLTVLESYSSYLWNTGDNTQSITVSTQGTYTVTVTDSGSNTSNASHILTVNPLPQVVITGGNILCTGTVKTLSTSNSYNTFLWSTEATSSSIQVSAPGNYSVMVVDNNGCMGEGSISITQVSNPSPIIQGPDFICPGGIGTLDAGLWNAYSWNDGRITRNLTITSGGSYTVTITDQNGCQGIANKNVQEYVTSPITIEGNLQICDGESTSLMVNPTTGIIQWSNGANTPSIMVANNGNYSVTVTDDNLCQVSESVEVVTPLPSILCPDDLYVTIHEPNEETIVQFSIGVIDNCGTIIPVIQTDNSGLTSGDNFPLGTTPQSYLLDIEGVMIGSCSFSVHVVQQSSKTILMENGDLFIKGLYKGAIYQSPDGNCWKITVNNKGEIKALKIDCPD